MFAGPQKFLKGAIIGVDVYNPVASLITFQYNPEKLTRVTQLKIGGKHREPGSTPAGQIGIPATYAKESQRVARMEKLHLAGAPAETFQMSIELNAADQLGEGDPVTKALGIYPQLSALEMLVYPKTSFLIANWAKLETGIQEVVPLVAPIALFVFGPKRVVPTKVKTLTIVEDLFDAKLNPIKATVTLYLQVLNYDDLPKSNLGFWMFMAHQVLKEGMATLGSSMQGVDTAVNLVNTFASGW